MYRLGFLGHICLFAVLFLISLGPLARLGYVLWRDQEEAGARLPSLASSEVDPTEICDRAMHSPGVLDAFQEVQRLHARSVAFGEAESARSLAERTERFEELASQVVGSSPSDREQDLQALMEKRSRFWLDVAMAQQLTGEAETAMAAKNYELCSQILGQYDATTSKYPDEPDASSFAETKARMAAIRAYAEEMSRVASAYQAIPSEPSERIDALKEFVKARGSANHEHVTEVYAEAERELAQLEVQTFLDGATGSIHAKLEKLDRACQLHDEYTDVRAREMLRQGVKAWLDEVLVEIPGHPEVASEMEEAIGVVSGKIVVGFYEQDETDETVYKWWRTLQRKIRWSDEPDYLTTIDRDHDSVNRWIENPPGPPAIVDLPRQYNEKARATRDDCLSESAWGDLKELCESLEAKASHYRELAKVPEDVEPEEFREAYRDLSFAQQARDVEEVIAHFGMVQRVCDLGYEELRTSDGGVGGDAEKSHSTKPPE